MGTTNTNGTGVLYSNSFFLDIANFWKERDKVFNKALVKSCRV